MRVTSPLLPALLPRLVTSIILAALSLTMHNAALAQDKPKQLRAGMIGLDTSHVPAFTKIFNAPDASGPLAGIKVVAGYPGGTDFPASRDRVKKFTETMAEMGVEIVSSIPELLSKVDVVLLESVDGRIHLEQAIPVIQAGKPMFIDKPLAGTLADAMAIYEFAETRKVPCFSSSSYRFSPGLLALTNNEKVGSIAGASTWGPCSYQAETIDMAFYGIHGIEALYTLMGSGCESVTRTKTADTDMIVGTWKGGRVGTYRGIRKNNADAGAVVYGSKGIAVAEKGGGYADLCVEIGKFFRTLEPPVSPTTTIEMFAFMAAADESVQRGGAPVSIAEMMKQAEPLSKKRLSEMQATVKR